MSKWGAAFQVGAVYIGTVVGAGFATGREIVQFFSKYGLQGFIGILISGLLFIWIGSKMMIIAKRIGAGSYNEFNEFLFGKTIGSIINMIMMLVLLGVTSVMLSGAGAVFEEQLGIPFQAGVLFTMVLAICVLLFGVKGLFSVNVFIVPLMIVFSTILAIEVMLEDGIKVGNLQPLNDNFDWLLSPFTYSAFNLSMAQAVLVPLAKEINDEFVLKMGGIIGGSALCFILIMSHISLSYLPNVNEYEIPMAEVMKMFMFSFHWLFIFIIFGEIFTSIIGDIFGLQRQINTHISMPNIVIVMIILFLAYMISQLGYSSLISVLYPIFGYISLALLFLLMAPIKYLVRK